MNKINSHVVLTDKIGSLHLYCCSAVQILDFRLKRSERK